MEGQRRQLDVQDSSTDLGVQRFGIGFSFPSPLYLLTIQTDRTQRERTDCLCLGAFPRLGIRKVLLCSPSVITQMDCPPLAHNSKTRAAGRGPVPPARMPSWPSPSCAMSGFVGIRSRCFAENLHPSPHPPEKPHLFP